MVQQYKPSNQAKTQPAAGYARNLPKGAPPVPTFLPAKTPPPAATSVARTAVPPRAGGEVTRRVADAQDYSKAYAQARAQQETPPPAYRPGAQPGAPTPTGIRQPMPAMARGTILGPAGGQPAGQLPPDQVGAWSNMALPPATLPQQDILQQLAAARAGMPTYEDLSAVESPFQQFKPLYSEAPGEGQPPPEEEATYPGGMTKEEWEAKKQAAFEQLEEESPTEPGEFSGERLLLQAALDYFEQGGELNDAQIALLEKYGFLDPHEEGQKKVSKGNYNLTAAEYAAMKESEGGVYTPDGYKWEMNPDTGEWGIRKMTEDEHLDYQLDQVGKDIADDSKFYGSLDAYATHMKRQLSEAQFLAGGQMSQAGIWSTGLGARRMMQVESKAMAEMSATMSDMIVDHQQAKWQAKLQWLQGKTSLWAQRKTIELQATLSSFNAAMQGADTFMEWLEAKGMGDYMDEYWQKVKACGEVGDVSSIMCVFSLYEEFRVDHEGKLGYGGKSAEELYDIAAQKEAKAVQKCGSCYDFTNWACCISQSDADDEFEHTAPNPKSGKMYGASGKPAYG